MSSCSCGSTKSLCYHLLRVGYQRSLPGPDGRDGKDGINTFGPAPDGLPGADGNDGLDGFHTVYTYNVTNGANGVGFLGTPPTTAPSGANGINGTDGICTPYNPSSTEIYYRSVNMLPGVPITLPTIFASYIANKPSMRSTIYMFVAATPDATSSLSIVATNALLGTQTVVGNFANIILDAANPLLTVTATLTAALPTNVLFGLFPLT